MRRQIRHVLSDERGAIELAGIVLTAILIGIITLLGYTMQSTINNFKTYTTIQASYQPIAQAFVRLDSLFASSDAFVIPTTDVLGESNSDGHEIDLHILEAAVGGNVSHFVAVRRNDAKTEIDYYTYSTPGQAATQIFSPLTSPTPLTFAATSVLASTLPQQANGALFAGGVADSTPVNKGFANVNATNAIARIRIANGVVDRTSDFLAGAAVDSAPPATVTVGTYTPPPPGTCTVVSSYTGNETTGWTPVDTTEIWQWYQPAAPCASATTPPPETYVSSYTPNCNTTFYAAVTSTAPWQNQPAPSATTPPPTTVLTGYGSGGTPIYTTYAWNQGPCPSAPTPYPTGAVTTDPGSPVPSTSTPPATPAYCTTASPCYYGYETTNDGSCVINFPYHPPAQREQPQTLNGTETVLLYDLQLSGTVITAGNVVTISSVKYQESPPDQFGATTCTPTSYEMPLAQQEAITAGVTGNPAYIQISNIEYGYTFDPTPMPSPGFDVFPGL